MFRGTHSELEKIGPARYRQTVHLRPIAYRRSGTLYRIDNNWIDGGPTVPHLVLDAPMLVSASGYGTRRIHPTREWNRWIEIGRPHNIATQEPFLMAPFTRQGNHLVSENVACDAHIWMGGHFVKFAFELKGGWLPPNGKVAFPVGMSGLTRQGGVILADGKPVLQMRVPVMVDWANEADVRPVQSEFVFHMDGQWYVVLTLPDLAGMARPVLDPTLVLQPDASAGEDNFLQSANPTFNYGASTALYIGEFSGEVKTTRALIRFDLSSLPAGAVISSATLSLFCVADYATDAATFSVYRQKRQWGEGAKLGADATAGESSWNCYAYPTTWQTAGGFGANDCEQAAIGSRAFSAAETLDEFKEWSLTASTKTDLDWGLENAVAATGWLIKSETESDDAYKFNPSDVATAGERPKLTIEYTYDPGLTLRTQQLLCREW